MGGGGGRDAEVPETQPWCFVTCAVARVAGMQGWAYLQKEKGAHYVHTYEEERLGMLGSRSREKQPLGTAFPTTHITYKCTWPEPVLWRAFKMRPEHNRQGASSASSHICSASPRDLGFTSGVSPSQTGLGLSQRLVEAWGWGPWHEGPASCRRTPPSAMPHLKIALAKLFNQFLKLGNF